MKKLSLRAESRKLRNYLRTRCSEYVEYENCGPGEPLAAVTRIIVGFEIEQSGWCAMIFDTRPDPLLDGSWTKWVDHNATQLQNWVYPDEAGLQLSDMDGDMTTVVSVRDFATLFGDMLLSTARDHFTNRVKSSLEVAEGCMITVEEFSGHFFWEEIV